MFRTIVSRVVARPVSLNNVSHTRSITSSHLLRQSAHVNPVPVHDHQRTVTLIPGDGVGPELMNAVQQVFESTGTPVSFEEHFLSEVTSYRSANLIDVVENIQKNGACLKGVIASGFDSPTGELQNLNSQLRRNLDLFCSVVHIKSLDGFKPRKKSPHTNLDFVVIRETVEGEYSALEHEAVPGVIECMKIITRKNSMRTAKFAFDFATKHKRKRVTAVHKANIMKLGDGLFLECCREIAKLYPSIEFNDMIIDNCCMQLVSNPHQFDVLVTTNLYGNIVDNLAAGLVGGAGVVPGESVAYDSVVFEPGARHSYAEAVGKNIANPTAMLRSACNMLRHLNLFYHARIIEDALFRVIKTGKIKTKDMGGYATTSQFTNAIIGNIKF